MDENKTRAAWLNQIQIENSCDPDRPGQPCHSHKCGCALEQQKIVDDFASNVIITLAEGEK